MADPGAVVLPARLLLDVVRSLPADHLTLELRSAEQDVELISGSATFHLRTLRAEDFPTLPVPSPDTRIALPAEAFVQTISRVARSASRDETRPVLTGILMSASGQELRMVATDSYRLSVKETSRLPYRAASRRTFPLAPCRSWRASRSRPRASRSPSASDRTRSSSSWTTSCSPRV
jgi:DNA polymerase III sliding clamp (beta) subunit (PCNA family)